MDNLVTRVLKTISKGRPRVDHAGVITANTIRAYIDALERATLLQAQREPQVLTVEDGSGEEAPMNLSPKHTKAKHTHKKTTHKHGH